MYQYICTHMLDMITPGFSLIIAVQILISNSLDKRVEKSYNTATQIGGISLKMTTYFDHNCPTKSYPLP